MKEIRVPHLDVDGKILLSAWLAKEGAVVEAGQTLAELEAGKTVVMVEAESKGRLVDLQVEEFTTVSPGQVIAYLAAEEALNTELELSPSLDLPDQSPAKRRHGQVAEPAPAGRGQGRQILNVMGQISVQPWYDLAQSDEMTFEFYLGIALFALKYAYPAMENRVNLKFSGEKYRLDKLNSLALASVEARILNSLNYRVSESEGLVAMQYFEGFDGMRAEFLLEADEDMLLTLFKDGSTLDWTLTYDSRILSTIEAMKMMRDFQYLLENPFEFMREATYYG